VVLTICASKIGNGPASKIIKITEKNRAGFTL